MRKSYPASAAQKILAQMAWDRMEAQQLKPMDVRELLMTHVAVMYKILLEPQSCMEILQNLKNE